MFTSLVIYPNCFTFQKAGGIPQEKFLALSKSIFLLKDCPACGR